MVGSGEGCLYLTLLFPRCINGCGHIQAASSEPAFPLSAEVIGHLGKVGGELMEAEVSVFEQGYFHIVYCQHIGVALFPIPFLPISTSSPYFSITSSEREGERKG